MAEGLPDSTLVIVSLQKIGVVLSFALMSGMAEDLSQFVDSYLIDLYYL
jgi:hypothetical protein